MKPTAATVIDRQGSLGGREIKMGFDPKNVAHLMGLLANLYSDLELAIIREYSNNARDSHIDAGQSRPIEVLLPSNWSSYFKVKDFGTGMSLDDLENTFANFGTSTKQDSNDVTGMMGIGAKCALAYNSFQFTITSVKDGEKIIVSVSKDETGVGVMEIVDVSYTDEDNGVEISVPVKPNNNFAYKAAEFFKYWPEGTVLVNGKAPERVQGEQITSTIMTIPGGGQDLIVMGDIAYPVEGNLYSGNRPWNNQFRVVATVPIGSVSIAPSREALLYDAPNTPATIKALREEIVKAIVAKVEADVAGAADHGEALARFIKWNNQYGRQIVSGATYKGEEIPLEWKGDFLVWYPNVDRYSTTRETVIDHATIQKSVVVEGFNLDKITPRHKEKMRKWADDNGKAVKQFLLTDDNPGAPWVQGEDVITWQTVTDIKLPTRANGKPVISYPVMTTGSTSPQDTESDDIDTKHPIYYVAPRDKVRGSRAQAAFNILGYQATIVTLGDNRLAKFKRDFPKAAPLNGAITKAQNEVRDALTKDDIQSLGMDYYDKSFLSGLDENKVDDPDLVKNIGIAKGLTTSPEAARFETVQKWSQTYGRSMDRISAPSLLGNYPLVRHTGRPGNLPHTYIYLNAAYAAIQNGDI